MRKDSSIVAKSLVYSALGFVVLMFISRNVLLSIIGFAVLFLFGLMFFKPSKEQKPTAGNYAGGTTMEARLSEEERLQAEGRKIIKQLNHYAFDIKDASVAKNLTDIVTVSAKILDLFKEKPELKLKVREYINYYLPSLQTVTERYIKTINDDTKTKAGDDYIQAYVKNLETTKGAFTNLYDNLLKEKFDEAKIEMEVLKTSLKSKGLINGNAEQEAQNS